MIELSKRLAAVARFAENGTNIADIGTDHGYIPVYLAQKGTAKRIAASDIGEGPLQSARSSAVLYGVEDKIEFIRADGLSGIDSSFDTVILAGMGGDNIISILSDAPWTRASAHLILQPQTRVEKLTEWLYNSGFALRDAVLVRDAGKLYIVLSAAGGSGKDTALPEWKKYALEPLISNRDPLLGEYIGQLKEKLHISISGMESGKSADTEKLEKLKKTYGELCEICGRYGI